MRAGAFRLSTANLVLQNGIKAEGCHTTRNEKGSNESEKWNSKKKKHGKKKGRYDEK